MSRADVHRVADIVMAAGEIASVVELGRPAFDSDVVLRRAVERCLEIMGEAAKAVSVELMAALGLVAFARSDAPSGRLGRAGAWLAVAGGVAYTIAHLVSVAAYDASTDDVGAIVAMSLFGVGTVALAVGLLLAGRSSLGDRRRPRWAAWAPLALGIWMVLMIPIQFTSALVVAVGGYAILVVAFGVSLINDRSAIEE